jgi:hypothetical protein
MSQVQSLEFDLRIAIFPFTSEGEFIVELAYCSYCEKFVPEDLVTWVELPKEHPDFFQVPYGMRQISCHNPACIKPPPPETNFL